MSQAKKFYSRYWQDKHIKANPFDHHPSGWTDENFIYHLNFFKPFIEGRLLDFGCGAGEFAHRISAYCELVCGIDISAEAIAKAVAHYPEIEFKVLEEENRIPYPDSFFNGVCAIDVLEHILDTEGVLEELNRVLKPEGRLFIATSELTRLKIVLIALKSLNNYFYPASAHIRYFTRRNLADILKQKGFEVIKYKKNRTYFGWIPQGQLVVASKKQIICKINQKRTPGLFSSDN